MKNYTKHIMKFGVAALICTQAGCIGTNALTAKLMNFNLRVVDNRYARGGVNFLLSPVYGLTALIDALFINSIEFWAGKNPMNGKPHIFDSNIEDTMIEINDDVSPGLQEAPLEPVPEGEKKKATSAIMTPLDEDTLAFTIRYNNGESAVLIGRKNGELVSFYMNDEFVTNVSIDELKQYLRKRSDALMVNIS